MTDPDVTPVMPEVGGGVAVRWVDPAAPWLGRGRRRRRRRRRTRRRSSPGSSLRYDDTKADLVHDEEYEAVLFPLGAHVDVTTAVAVDYDDRDLRDAAPAAVRLPAHRRADRPGGVLEAGASATSSTT